MKITRISPLTNKENVMEVEVTHEQLESWQNGTPIQVVMPNLTPAEREFIMTGYTQEDWDRLFPKTNED